MHQRVLREPVDAIARLLPSCYFFEIMMTRQVPQYWRIVNISPVFENSKKANAENYSFTLVPEKMMENSKISELGSNSLQPKTKELKH